MEGDCVTFKWYFNLINLKIKPKHAEMTFEN